MVGSVSGSPGDLLRLPKGKKRSQKGNKGSTAADGKEVAMSASEKRLRAARKKYIRNVAAGKRGMGKIKDKKLKAKLKAVSNESKAAADALAEAEILLPSSAGFIEVENEMERTYKVTQKEIKESVDKLSANRAWNLDRVLDAERGPYRSAYTQNGRYLVIGGKGGDLRLLDCGLQKMDTEHKTLCEVDVNEEVRDVTFMHNHTFLRRHWRKHVYIYDSTGVEIHKLKSHITPTRLEFLRHHFLLATVGLNGWLKYQDTSTGKLIAEKRTRLGPCRVMKQNPYNAVIGLGHRNGTVTMWSPSMNEPLVKIFAHPGGLTDIAFDLEAGIWLLQGMTAAFPYGISASLKRCTHTSRLLE